MGFKLKKLQEQVIVITGASSGIGLATAEMAASAGAGVVLSARNETDLRQACDRIRSAGGRAVYVAGDIANPDVPELLANRAISEFGRIDTWVNNAGIGMYGRLTETSMADKRRLFDVNFWGVVYGCRTAVRHLRAHGGTIINIGSVTSDRALPLLGIYSASKHAVKGYTDALRMELEEEGLPIAVTLVKPASINTPFIEHARNHMDVEPEFAPPVYAPEEVARAILRCAERPMRDVIVGGSGRALTMMGKLAPRLTDLYMERTAFDQQRSDQPRHTADALYAPQDDGRLRSRHSVHTTQRSAYTRAALSDIGRALPVLAIGAFVAASVQAMRKAG